MMKRKIVCLVALIVVSTVAVSPPPPQKGQIKEFKVFCKGKELKTNGNLRKDTIDCLTEMRKRFQSEDDDESDEKKKMKNKFKVDTCMAACRLDKMKAVKDGKIDIDYIYKWIDDVYPDEARDTLKKAMKLCTDDVKKKLSKENDCESYKPFSKCMGIAIRDACKKDKEEKKGV